MADEKSETAENMRWEYREVATNHRFYVGLRFIIAAFTGTLQPTLLKFYSDAMLIARRLQAQGIHPPEWWQPQPEIHPVHIALVGMVAMVAVFFMERRNITRLDAMVSRGSELEFRLGLGDGQYGRFSDPGRFNLFTYPRSLTIIYSLIGMLWLVSITARFQPLLERIWQ